MTKYLPAAAAATTGILVGAAIVATRFVIGQTGPATLALLRYLIGFGCLLPLLLLSTRVRFVLGEQSTVTVFLALSPVSATILGALALAEMPSTTTLFGLACVAFGIWLAHRS